MKYFEDFDKALDYFREIGGAMNYDHPGWHVGGAGEIEEMATCSAKEATANALLMGNFGVEHVEEELADWQ